MARFSIIMIAFLLALVPAAYAQNAYLAAQWPNTDFSKTTVDLAEIRSGGPGKDGIPAVDAPTFRNVPDERRIGPREPVMTSEIRRSGASSRTMGMAGRTRS